MGTNEASEGLREAVRLQGHHKLAAYTVWTAQPPHTNWELEFGYKVSYADEPPALVMEPRTAIAPGGGRASVL